MDINLAQIQHALSRFRAKKLPGSKHLAQAATAMVLHQPTDRASAELLFIRRAEHPNDPWSGHMAFPGGRRDPGDPSPIHTAIRETQEELGLNLDRSTESLSPLSQLMAGSVRKIKPLVVCPFVFAMPEEPPVLSPNHEVAESLWIPLSFFANSAHRSTMQYKKMGVSWTLPCYRYEGRVIWGLSLKMLDELMALLR